MKFKRRIIAALLSLFCSLVSYSEEAAVDTVALNELVVTAIKQSEDLQSLPMSSSLVTAVQTERLNVAAVKGISDLVPNLFIPDYGSRMTSSIYVRGLGARIDQPAVGLSIDNVPVLSKDAYDLDIADISRVEMLRGPQSTLYGRNTMGGQINISTLSPLAYQGVRVAAAVGNGFAGKVSAGWYGRICDDMGISVTAGYSYSDGWFRNEYTGEKADRERLWNARLKYEWRLSDSMSLSNTFAASGLHQGGYPYEYLGTGRIEYNDTCFYRRFCLSDGLTVRWLLPGVSLTSMTSVQYLDDNMTLDQDFLPLSYFTLTQKKRETGVTEEVVARGNAGFYSWTAGVFGFYKHLDMDAPVTFLDYGISQLIEKYRNAANPQYPIAWDTRSFPLNSSFTIPTAGAAAYHESNFTVGRWRFTAGLRLDYEHVRMRYRSGCRSGYTVLQTVEDGSTAPYAHIDVNIDENGRLSRSFVELLPKFAVMYSLDGSADNNVYATVSKGYKAGGFNTQMFSDILQQDLMGLMGINATYDVDEVVGYRPEKSWNYEVGAHLQTADGRLRGDAALFYIDCRDQQLTVFPNGNTTGRMMTNAGRTRSFGAEVQLSVDRVGPFSFCFSYGYTDARFRKFNNGIADYRGKRVPYAPQNTVFAQAVYRRDCGGALLDDITADVNVRAAGDIYWNEANTLSQPLYAQLGASVTLRRGCASLQLWGENLTDTRFSTFYFVSIGNEFVQRGRPLRFGATLRLSF